MAVIEYKLHRINGGDRKEIPGFVGDRGHWMSPIDGTFVGWVDDNSDYYVPDTIVEFTKAEFVTRQLAIHADTPFMNHVSDPSETPTQMTTSEVTTMMEDWYDDFVTKNGG